ncbi:MAG: glycosyltransferase WbuB [Cytophagales bacterium]|nr:MAG: glycosyltransferase WbuB [Cytophagales bacterium]
MAKADLVTPHVLIISPNYPPEQGACASRIRYMAQGLAKAGYRVEVLTAMPNYPKGKVFDTYRNKLFFRRLDENVLVKHYPIYPSHSASILPRLLGMFSLAFSVLFHVFSAKKSKPTLVIAQSPPLLLALSAYWLSVVYKAEFVLNISDLWPRALLDLGAIKKGFIYGLVSKLEVFLYRKAKLCIGQSEEILSHIQAQAPAQPTFLYRTGVDCDFFQVITPQEIGNRPFKIVYAGLLGIAQGILSICKKLNFKELNAEMHIYGDGYERKLLATYLAKHPHLGIYLHDSVAYEQMPSVLLQYDAMLVTQKNIVYGTVPSKIYEAMSVGLPILFCGGGEGANIILENGVGLVSPPSNFDLLKENILEMTQMPLEEKKILGAKGRQFALSKLDRKMLIIRLIEQLAKVGL